MDPGNRRAVLAAMLANGGLAVARFVGCGLDLTRLTDVIDLEPDLNEEPPR